MSFQRAERKFNLGLGTTGLILAVVGAAWDYGLDGVSLGMAIFGIVAASIGMMLMATHVVKESTSLNAIACIDLRILLKGGILTAFGGVSIFICLMIQIMVRGFKVQGVSAHDDDKIKVGWPWWLMFNGSWMLLLTGCFDLCNNYFLDVDGYGNVEIVNENVADENGNEGDNDENDGNEMEDMINDSEVRNDRENVVNEESQM